MSPHLLRTRLGLERPVALADGAGGASVSWSQEGLLWGALEPLSGREAGHDGAAVSRVRYRITLRGAPVGAPSRPRVRDRLRAGVRCFEITAVREADPAARFLICDAVEEVSA
ncbi:MULTISPECIES: head-tail adaptor protein [unclassified Meridianimarinicoccus]|uniref:head-tail adaptor protein n=1 Tax=unclassified Meridianimarinicoccus TaxID=2923344 RepID=UPI001866A446|nr:head-tail adaptor protein [Fluviibacterium sp. MJW13]